jgi:hypothetical protein
MSEAKQASYLPWIAVAVLGYMLWSNQTKLPDPKPDPKPDAISITKVLDGVYKQDRSDRLQLLKELSTKQFDSDKAKMEWYNAESTRRRIQTNTPFTDRVAEAMFSDSVADLVKQLEAGK